MKPTVVRKVKRTEADIVNFAGVSGDFVELHVSEEYAKKGPFGRRIAHGMLTLSIASGLMVQADPHQEVIIAFYGIDKLRFVKEVEPETLDLLVPSMLLQPLVENSIRHGLASKVDGGTIRVRSRRIGHQLQIVVEDNGVGIPEARLARMFEQGGIGVNNVNERLKVLYGDSYRMWIDSRPGEGTSTGIEIPEQVSGTVVGVESLVGSG